MAPATESIMGALPLAKAGVGSAMNDTTRMVGGALGVAVLGTRPRRHVSQRDRAGGRGPAGTGRHGRCGLHRRGDRRWPHRPGTAGEPLLDGRARRVRRPAWATPCWSRPARRSSGAALVLAFLPARPAPTDAEGEPAPAEPAAAITG